MSNTLGFFKSLVNTFVRVTDVEPLPVKPTNTNTNAGSILTLTTAGLGTVNGSDLANLTSTAVRLYVNISAISGTTPTLTITVEGRDEVSGNYYTILQSAALNATGGTVLSVGIGLPVTANVSANAILPTTWRVKAVIGGTGPSVSATVGAVLIG
jgi:hypothetical protein